jgi:AMP nucleosidase
MPHSRPPKSYKAKKFKEAKAAFSYLCEIYESNTQYLRDAFAAFEKGNIPDSKIRACYPYIKVDVEIINRADPRLSYGFVSKPGVYSTTVTRPDIFGDYLLEQIQLLILNHDCPVEVGVSDDPIPMHFALSDEFHLERDLDQKQTNALPYVFDVPDMIKMDDSIANNIHHAREGEDRPLALFNGSRTDLSLMRLRHYTGTSASHFQKYVIYTNYQFYIDEFINMCHDIMSCAESKALQKERSEYTAFVEPGNIVTVNSNSDSNNGEEEVIQAQPLGRLPQMPAYHLKRADGSGITMVNIGVGPSNAKTITDHIAVLRSHSWLMLGHCAGLRNSQSIGDYVLAHAYFRIDNVLDGDLPIEIPIPALAEMQQALEKAVGEVTGFKGYDLKKIMRTGTVATIDDRNWELRPGVKQNLNLSQSRAIAMDMESGTIAGNGFRFRVPYGTLLCVSDRPLHGQPKLPGMADKFYRDRIEQHLQIGLMTMNNLREIESYRLHSRKLRSFSEVAFQ